MIDAVGAFDNDFWQDAAVVDDGVEVTRKVVGDSTLVIRQNECQVEAGEAQKLLGAMEQAFKWEGKVLLGKAKTMFWKKGVITLTVESKMAGAMQNNFHISESFAGKKSEQTIAAAMFHEIIEMWRDEFGLIGEGAPLMAEFLMCGDDRLMFGELCKDFEGESDAYQIGWNKVAKEFGFGEDSEVNLFEEMGTWKRSLSEDQKLEVIRTRLLDWKQ